MYGMLYLYFDHKEWKASLKGMKKKITLDEICNQLCMLCYMCRRGGEMFSLQLL